VFRDSYEQAWNKAYLNRARIELEAHEAAVTDWEKFRGFERL
jgi:glutamine synthetase